MRVLIVVDTQHDFIDGALGCAKAQSIIPHMKERIKKYVAIAERAEKDGLYKGKRATLLMDIESADLKFDLRLDEWLKADKFNFAHDFYGIVNNIDREKFPSTDFNGFLPRFAS